MSGGSFDYLCYKDPATDVYALISGLKDMEESMRGDGYHYIANELFKYRLMIETYINRASIVQGKLESVMHAYEWWKSCDSDEEGFVDVVNSYFEGG